MPASATLLQAVMVTAELCGYPFTSESVATVFIEDLAGYPESLVLAALKRCRLEHKGRLTVADVLSRIEDGRPGVETAWAQVATLTDERKSLVWCEEMRQAWAACLPLLDNGDPIAARMAFKEAYTRLLSEARLSRRPPCWTLVCFPTLTGLCELERLPLGQVVTPRSRETELVREAGSSLGFVDRARTVAGAQGPNFDKAG